MKIMRSTLLPTCKLLMSLVSFVVMEHNHRFRSTKGQPTLALAIIASFARDRKQYNFVLLV